MRIKETFTKEIKGQTVEILNDGIAKFKDQNKEALPSLLEYLGEEIDKGERDGWLPYANFEASITWAIQEPQKSKS